MIMFIFASSTLISRDQIVKSDLVKDLLRKLNK